MPRLHDEEGRDDWDGQDWADETTHPRSIRDTLPELSQNGSQVDLDNNGYVLEWKSISDSKRMERDYTCEECNVRLHDHLKLLHVHHIDRDKQDNSPQNLRVLCVICHSNCEGHEHLADTVLPSERALIKLRRVLEQGLSEKNRSRPPKPNIKLLPHTFPRSPPPVPIEVNPSQRPEQLYFAYHQYQIIARFWKGGFRARATSFSDKRRIDAQGVSIEDAIRKLRELIHVDIEEQEAIQRERLPDLHKARMERDGLPYYGIRKRTISAHRMTHCYNCKSELDNTVDVECVACGWIVCRTCAACGCGYACRPR